MAEYIEREALLKRLKFKRDTESNMDGRKRYGLDSAISQVRKAPTADVVELKHGEWIKITKDIGRGRTLTYYQCDKCGVYLVKEANYCPNCGAKMDGVKALKEREK